MNLNFNKVRFVTTAVEEAGYPNHNLPEIAVAGRSNVGKSSLLNHLFQRKGLVKTSAKPGKTQTINFFSADDECLFVDLPGYGYAAVPKAMRLQWGHMMEEYLSNRSNLKLLLFLVDIRRTPSDDDLQLWRWAARSGVPILVLLTKCDKTNQSERHKNSINILETLGSTEIPHIHYSVKKGGGRQKLVGAMRSILNNDV